MRTTLIQISAGSRPEDNIATAKALIEQAVAADRPDLIVLPEMWSCLGGTRTEKFAAAETLPSGASDEKGPFYRFLQDMAVTHGIFVHGGSIGVHNGDRLLNTSLVFDRSGAEIARYSKIHLFDITTPSGEGYRESNTYCPGNEVVTVNLDAECAGLAICYDLRFGELFLDLRRKGASMIILPAAFTAETGQAHWEALIRARAIETQCWMLACGTTGTHHDHEGQPRRTFGHSMIVDPWGTVVAQASGGQGWTTARIDPALTASVRAGIPVLEHRRLGR